MKFGIARLIAACLLSVSSLAFANSSIEVKAASNVEAAGTSHFSYNFGRVWVNSVNRVIYNIRNTGSVPLAREGFSIGGHGYSAYTNCPEVMYPGTICDLEIRFSPYFEGIHSGRLYLLLSDNNDLIFNLWGEAFR